MTRKLYGETVCKRIATIREQIAKLERELNAIRFEASEKIIELQRRCLHERTSTSMGTPYDKGETTCDDCGARVI